jgi:hypothetical protein
MLDTVDGDRALIGCQQPVEHVHQRGLASAIFTKQTVDLTRQTLQVDRVVGDQVAESLGDPPQSKTGSGCGGRVAVTPQ